MTEARKRFSRKELFSTVAYLGTALLVAGIVRYSVQETLTRPTQWILIGGGVMLLAALAGNLREVLGYFRSRPGRLGTNTAVLALGVTVILGLVNFLGFRHSKRFDWTAEKLYTLSDQTQKIVTGLQKDVKVIRFDRAKGADPLRDFVQDYRHLSRHITYELVDPQERPELARQYAARRMGDVVVASGNRTEHVEDPNEQSITSAILKVTRDTVKTVCFVEGHGEKAFSDADAEGLSSVEKGLEGENYQVKGINLVRSNQVPAECSVVVVAGPKNAYFPQETEMLTKYLDAGGKAMLLLDPQTDPQLDALLSAWNITAGKNLVIDYSGMGQLIGLGPASPLVTQYGEHAITRTFGRNTMTFFPSARTVETADKKKSDPPVTELLFTTPESWAETNLKESKLKFDPGEDEKGPVSLGAAAEKSLEGKAARLVVIGNSEFVTNQFIRHSPNRDLFLNAVNWLTLEEDLISIRPKTPTNRRVTLSVAQEKMFFWFSLVLMPGAVIVTGFVLWWKRR